MRISGVDVVRLGSTQLRRWAEEMGRRRWCELSDEELVNFIFRAGVVEINHVELCAMFPPARTDDDTEPTAGNAVQVDFTVRDAPQLHGWRLFRAFGLDQAILTYWYAGDP